MDRSPAQIIEDKGVENIASKLGMSLTAVRMWRARNRIPRAAWPELTDAFPDLDNDALREIEARGEGGRSPPDRAAA